MGKGAETVGGDEAGVLAVAAVDGVGVAIIKVLNRNLAGEVHA